MSTADAKLVADIYVGLTDDELTVADIYEGLSPETEADLREAMKTARAQYAADLASGHDLRPSKLDQLPADYVAEAVEQNAKTTMDDMAAKLVEHGGIRPHHELIVGSDGSVTCTGC